MNSSTPRPISSQSADGIKTAANSAAVNSERSLERDSIPRWQQTSLRMTVSKPMLVVLSAACLLSTSGCVRVAKEVFKKLSKPVAKAATSAGTKATLRGLRTFFANAALRSRAVGSKIASVRWRMPPAVYLSLYRQWQFHDQRIRSAEQELSRGGLTSQREAELHAQVQESMGKLNEIEELAKQYG